MKSRAWYTLMLITNIMVSSDALKALQIDGDNGTPATVFPLAECSGDCDSNAECFGDLRCYQRSGIEAVPGCTGTGVSAKDYCYKPNGQSVLAITGDGGSPPRSFPLGMCEGDCDTNADCAPGLVCFQRSGTEAVPGCSGLGTSGKDYCYSLVSSPPTRPPTRAPTRIPTRAPTRAPTISPTIAGTFPTGAPTTKAPTRPPTTKNPTLPAPSLPPVTTMPPTKSGVTYVPGDLTVLKAGLRLSTGLDVRVIATKGQRVQFANGGQSTANFHVDPDGAAVFLKNDGSGNYFYTSNSEEPASNGGGVGSIEFTANGAIVGYQRVLTGTNNNCGGGRSPYNTWLTGEENGSTGYVWEASPEGAFVGRKTNLVPYGGNFESIAYHYDASIGRHVYYTTEDSSSGPLVQFTPSANLGTREEMYSTGTHKYLRVDSGTSGTFSWVATKSQATPSLYPNAEGIDIKDDVLYFVSKVDKTLFILQLNQGTFTKESTNQGAFNNQPDQVARIVGSDPQNILYFCEDGGTYCGVHARNPTGQYFTILDNDPATTSFSGETTGLAFSPDNKRMYVAFQTPGVIFEIFRTDGYPFGGAVLDIKYHALVARRL